MILKFENFKNNKLIYYGFDVDDNLIHMDTKIHMDKKVDGKWVPYDVSSDEFAEIRNNKEDWRPRNNDYHLTFSDMSDDGVLGNEAFLTDFRKAVDRGNFGPAWDSFIKCLIGANLFAIITLRGHESNSIRKAIEYVIDDVLTEDQQFTLYNNCLKFYHLFSMDTQNIDRIPKGRLSQTKIVKEYLDKCDFYGVTSKSFKSKHGDITPEEGKEIAMNEFVEKCRKYGKSLGYDVSLGFSDDDPKNVEQIRKYFKEKSYLPDISFKLYKTTDRSIKGGELVNIHETNYGGSSNYDGMQNSVLPFTKWNNITQYHETERISQDPKQLQINNNKGSLIDLAKMAGIKKKIIRKKIKKKKKNKSL